MDQTEPSSGPKNRSHISLAILIAEDKMITFEARFPDKEFPYIICSMWGSIPANELFVRLTNGIKSFVDAFQSPLAFPPMADRIFGMDVDDSEAATALADCLWEKHKGELIIAGKTK